MAIVNHIRNAGIHKSGALTYHAAGFEATRNQNKERAQRMHTKADAKAAALP
jgi:hypothetical protein